MFLVKYLKDPTDNLNIPKYISFDLLVTRTSSSGNKLQINLNIPKYISFDLLVTRTSSSGNKLQINPKWTNAA